MCLCGMTQPFIHMTGLQNAPLLSIWISNREVILHKGDLLGDRQMHASLEDAGSVGPQRPTGTGAPTGTQCSSKALKSGAEVGKAVCVVSYTLRSCRFRRTREKKKRKVKREREHAERHGLKDQNNQPCFRAASAYS